MPPNATRPAPRHLYVVGALALAWNAGGVFDYLLTVSRSADSLVQMPLQHLAYLGGFPAWMTASWATALWAGIAGAVLLLVRRRGAAVAFAAALIATAAASLYTVGVRGIPSGAGVWGFAGAVWIVALGLWLYAREMARRGVLR